MDGNWGSNQIEQNGNQRESRPKRDLTLLVQVGQGVVLSLQAAGLVALGIAFVGRDWSAFIAATTLIVALAALQSIRFANMWGQYAAKRSNFSSRAGIASVETKGSRAMLIFVDMTQIVVVPLVALANASHPTKPAMAVYLLVIVLSALLEFYGATCRCELRETFDLTSCSERIIGNSLVSSVYEATQEGAETFKVRGLASFFLSPIREYFLSARVTPGMVLALALTLMLLSSAAKTATANHATFRVPASVSHFLNGSTAEKTELNTDDRGGTRDTKTASPEQTAPDDDISGVPAESGDSNQSDDYESRCKRFDWNLAPPGTDFDRWRAVLSLAGADSIDGVPGFGWDYLGCVTNLLQPEQLSDFTYFASTQCNGTTRGLIGMRRDGTYDVLVGTPAMEAIEARENNDLLDIRHENLSGEGVLDGEQQSFLTSSGWHVFFRAQKNRRSTSRAAEQASCGTPEPASEPFLNLPPGAVTAWSMLAAQSADILPISADFLPDGVQDVQFHSKLTGNSTNAICSDELHCLVDGLSVGGSQESIDALFERRKLKQTPFLPKP